MVGKIKVLFIINELGIGGAEKLLMEMAIRLVSLPDFSVGILTIEDSRESHHYKKIKEHPDIKLYEIYKETKFKLSFLPKIRAIAKKYDIIHAHLFPSGYLAVLANLFADKPIIYTEHSTNNRRRSKSYLRPIERWIYSRYSIIAGISVHTTKALREWLKSENIEGNSTTVYNGINLESFKSNQRYLAKDVFGREGKPVIMISRFVEAKDQATLVKAIPLIEDKDIFIVFVGDGYKKEECLELTREMGVENRCLFLGERQDVVQLIMASYLGVQSSLWEGFGLTAIEMMAGGLPVIASDVPGLGDIVRGAGITFPKGDYTALAKAINTLAANPDEYDRIKALCQERAKEYDINITVNKYIELYRNVLNQ